MTMKNIFKSSFLLALFFTLLFSCIEEDYFGKSTYNKITNFRMPQQIGNTQIDHDSLIIRISVSEELDITNVQPATLTISNFAKIVPGPEQALDFTDPVDYTVTAEDGTPAVYTVFVQPDVPIVQVENAGFNSWYNTAAGYVQIGSGPNDTTWSTGNEGVVTLGDANTVPEIVNNDTVAKLTTIKLGSLAQLIGQGVAAGSLFTGSFELNIANPPESPQFGTPFIGRPEAFKIDFRYLPGPEMNNGFGNPIPGKDSVDIAVLLEDRSSTPWKRVATAWYRSDQTTVEWTTLELPLQYGEIANPAYYEEPTTGIWGTGEETPTHISVILSSSARGAFFEGAPGSELWVNDFELVY